MNGRVQVRNVIGHEDVAAGMIEPIEADGFNAYAGDPHAGPGTPHEEAVQNTHVTHDEARGETDERRDGSGQGPEDEHDDGADHVNLTLMRLDPNASLPLLP